MSMRSYPLMSRAVIVAMFACAARGESMHPFGIHFWDWGANVDVQSHRTGWVVEANATSGSPGPNVGGRYKPATAQGYTVLQRLDWKWEQTIPLTPAEQDIFAQECANWASAIKNYCRTYSIGNEVEFFNVTSTIYASCFTRVRNAIKAVQPEARVIIGHMNNINSQRTVMQMVGPEGHDGVTAHTGSSVPTSLLDFLDQENALPHAGVYITEWGWVAGTNGNAANVMRGFYNAIGQSNATRARQVYCACWYLYPNFLGVTFSLELSPIDNAGFEAATALGTSFNTYVNNRVLMTNLFVDVPDAGTSANISWNTNVGARRQMWWTPLGTSGAGNESLTDLTTSLNTSHQYTIAGLTPQSSYEFLPNSTRDGYGDAGGRRFPIKTGPWTSTATQIAGRRVRVEWSTDWPADSRVYYGTTQNFGSVAEVTAQVTQHVVDLPPQPLGLIYYRIGSAQPNPDGHDPLVMRGPTRVFNVTSLFAGDFDGDEDVDGEDFGHLQGCLSGSGTPQHDPACLDARLDSDEDVDGDDVAIFSGCLSGSTITAELNCYQP